MAGTTSRNRNRQFFHRPKTSPPHRVGDGRAGPARVRAVGELQRALLSMAGEPGGSVAFVTRGGVG